MFVDRRRAPSRGAAGTYTELRAGLTSRAVVLRIALIAGFAALWLFCARLAEVDPIRLIEGLPRLVQWAARSWPPFLGDLDAFLLRAAETLAIAFVGTTIAAVAALPLSILVGRNVTPFPALGAVLRALIDALRGIDTVIFALLFVAAVGLGPFAGVLGMIVHTIGVLAKLNAEAIETIPTAPLDAAAMTGANQAKVVSLVILPSVMPTLTSHALYLFEANVRTSTVLGIVGAGGIGIEIKAAIDLLDFSKLLTLSVIVVVMVAAIDRASAALRRWLV